MSEASQTFGHSLKTYQDLHRWSVESPEEFWPAVAAFTGMKFNQPSKNLTGEVPVDSCLMPGARWFSGARLNFAENLLQFRDHRPAIIFRDETGYRSTLSFAELNRSVALTAAGLRNAGVTAGDRVAGFMPNHPEAVVAMLAATSIGAIWSSCSPDFGINGVLDRFGQIEPKVLFTADGYHYGGKIFDCLDTVAELGRRIDSIVRIVVVPYVDPDPHINAIPNAVLAEQFIANDGELEFVSLPFDHPVYILYSSGTTGVPKCIVHGAGGTLIQHLKEHALHIDLDRDDRLFFFTTCGWMMWNWLVSGLATGATIVLYDGSPFHPDSGALWRIADQEEITVFGVGAKYLAAVEKSGYEPGSDCQLNSIKTILSTGSPLAPTSYDFVYEKIKSDVQLASISGGTDLIACFALADPTAPVYRGELQCIGLGMAVDIYDDQGRPLPDNEKGELVCTRPFPSMPVGFWQDPDGSRYRSAYFDRFPNVWAHGDYAEKTSHGGLIIYGRSDSVLNPGGVRIGTAEIYRQVEKVSAVLDCVAIGQAWQGDTRIVLFVVLRAGAELDDRLRDEICRVIRADATPRHVPAKIISVAEIPRTRSGKIVELAVRDIVHGEPVKNTEALANPEALNLFRDLPELET